MEHIWQLIEIPILGWYIWQYSQQLSLRYGGTRVPKLYNQGNVPVYRDKGHSTIPAESNKRGRAKGRYGVKSGLQGLDQCFDKSSFVQFAADCLVSVCFTPYTLSSDCTRCTFLILHSPNCTACIYTLAQYPPIQYSVKHQHGQPQRRLLTIRQDFS